MRGETRNCDVRGKIIIVLSEEAYKGTVKEPTQWHSARDGADRCLHHNILFCLFVPIAGYTVIPIQVSYWLTV